MFKRKGSQKGKDPSVPFHKPTTSRDVRVADDDDDGVPKAPFCRRCFKYIYDRDKKLFCGRSCKSWMCIIAYSIMYLIFLCTYTMIFLYATLSLIKYLDKYEMVDKVELMTYSENGIGLSAAPTNVRNFPIISYRMNTGDDEIYVKELGEMFKRRKRNIIDDLGPCGTPPFGYWSKPCVIIRINKQLSWSAKPLANDTGVNIPHDVRQWMKSDKQKLWLHCHGYHSYDKEHIGRIIYHPDPPGFDPELYPLDMPSESPLVAVQIAEFTLGISLTVECTLWYEGGSSSIAFLLYVTPRRKIIVSDE